MPYDAKVARVMIASPSDVAPERNMARGVIHEWNAVHSFDRKLVLLPVGWETHSAPEMGDRAQALINKRVLKDCDLLVATFWTRIGSPTGDSASGTVEEIDEHLAEDKPAMLYFSDAPVHPDSVDGEQYQALKNFKQSCKDRGLVESYQSLEEFRSKFSRHLAQTIIREYRNPTSSSDENIDPPAETGPVLDDTAKELLKQIAQDKNGQLLCVQVMGGLIVQTNGQQLAQMGDARDEARWREAIAELTALGLLQARGHKGEVFALTSSGFELADQLGTPGMIS